ncbi:MAG: UDP-N-acetylmuramoyl-tripeptide--D-alanyl-D-alanine ligase [Bacillota bacterium]
MVYLHAILFLSLMLAYGFHYFNMLQKNNYKFKTNLKSQTFYLFNSMIILFSGVIITMLSGRLSLFVNSIILNCFLYAMIFYLAISYFNKRQKFVFTARGKRLFGLYSIVCIISLSVFLIRIQHLMFLTIFIILFLTPLISIACNNILLPFETRNNKKYIVIAKNKLASSNMLIKIGITGSFAKTSCKNFLNYMLSAAYNVHATKASYNTPLGIAKSVSELNKAADVFIAEMGARKTGDIKELVDIVKPKYGIMTGVTCQHLETFRTVENIFKEKEELVKGLHPDGFCVFNGENSYSKYMYNKAKIEKTIVGFDDSYDVYAKNIKITPNGSNFEMFIEGKKIICHTRLLGKHNILNILLCASLAKKLGISDNDLRKKITSLEPVPHRLQVIKSPNGITIIDDSYNCNLEGAVSALQTLAEFDGRKTVFSQGIIELGFQKQKETNKYLGYLISKVADIVILCGENSDYIKDGLKEKKFKGKIYTYKSLKAAQKDFTNILKSGDVLLLQNDLPEYY